MTDEVTLKALVTLIDNQLDGNAAYGAVAALAAAILAEFDVTPKREVST